MKNYIVIFIVAILFTSCATKSSFNSFYEENKKQSDFSISSPAFFANLFIPKDDIKEYEDLFKKVRHYKVLIFSDASASLDDKFERFIKAKKYTSIFRISQNGDKIQFYFLSKKAVIKEMILKVNSDSDFVLVGLKTNLLESDFNRIIENSDVTVVSN